MNASVGGDPVERLRAVVAGRLGLRFDEDQTSILAQVLERRLAAGQEGCKAYLARLEAGPPRLELRALARELTVAETYFFRNADHFRALREVVLPQRLRAPAAARRISILSAGCASGEEAFSIAIVVRETVADPTWEVSIRGVDVNPAALEKAERARFSSWSLRETSQETKRRWFLEEGSEAVLEESLRRAVVFEERNLAEEDGELWQPASHDVVFCRNVLMYLTPECAQALVARISRALAPGGYLFLGHAETLRGLSADYHLRHTHGTFYYQRRQSGELPAPPAASAAASPAELVPVLAAAVAASDTWVETIRRASERIQALCRPAQRPASTGGRPSPGWDLGRALDLLRRERFAEALAEIQALPAESARDPDVLLLTGVLRAHSGQLPAAEETCRRLLALDELNAGAHYVLALCREGAGDRQGAVEHDQVAVYLDPAFAMPRLHLGLLARRAGDGSAARRELAEAVVLLQREDASRLLLFGGGFGRGALIALCRAEVEASGGAP